MGNEYVIGFATQSAEKCFDKYMRALDAGEYRRVRERIKVLCREPRPPGKAFKILRPPLEIYQSVANYRLRIGDHRVLYDVDDEVKRVILIAIRRRTEKTYRE
jgi:mRNA interferase RelE/StbE